MFEKFRYLSLEVTMASNEKSVFPNYHGSMLRGVIGQTLRKVSCNMPKNQECITCKSNMVCPYAKIFYCINESKTISGNDSELSVKEDKMLSNVDTLPNPFIIYPVMKGKRLFKEGEEFKFHLTVLGKALMYIHYFVHAISEIENRGLGSERKKFKLLSINDSENQLPILKDGILYPENLHGKKLSVSKRATKEIVFNFDTPLRIKDGGNFTQMISFEVLMKNILRRISMVGDYFMDDSHELPYQSLLEESKKIRVKKMDVEWVPLERYSSHTNRKLSMGGVIGSVIFEGDLQMFLPYIQAAQVLHIGKGCTMGLGHYKTKIC